MSQQYSPFSQQGSPLGQPQPASPLGLRPAVFQPPIAPAAPVQAPPQAAAPAQVAPNAAPTLPGASPQQMAQVQQALASPNGADAFLQQLQAAAAGTTGMAGAQAPGMPPMPPMESPFPNPAQFAMGALAGGGVALGLNAVDRAGLPKSFATTLDHLPLVGPASQKVAGKLDDWVTNSKSERLKVAFTKLDPASTEKIMRNEIVDGLTKKFGGENMKPFLESRLKDVSKLGDLETLFKEETFVKELSEKAAADGLKASKVVKNFHGASNYAKGQLGVLERYAERFHLMSNQKMGLGRSFSGVFNRLQNVFNAKGIPVMPGGKSNAAGVAQKVEGAATGTVKGLFDFKNMKLGKLAPPMLLGGLVMGQSFKEAHEAKDGDKVKSFFHNFLGEGLGMFMGWEASKGLLRGTGILGKIIPNGLKFMRFAKAGSVYGFAAEMLAMFVLSVPFSKAGEFISDKLFGKPPKKEEKPGGLAGMAGMMPAAAAAPLASAPQGQSALQNRRFANFNPGVPTAAVAFGAEAALNPSQAQTQTQVPPAAPAQQQAPVQAQAPVQQQPPPAQLQALAAQQPTQEQQAQQLQQPQQAAPVAPALPAAAAPQTPPAPVEAAQATTIPAAIPNPAQAAAPVATAPPALNRKFTNFETLPQAPKPIDGAPSPDEIAQSSARTVQDQVNEGVLSDISARWKDMDKLVPENFGTPGGH